MLQRKSLIIFSFVCIGLICIIPIIGNTLIKDTLEFNIKKFESHGIQIIKSDETTSYLETAREYEFLLKDSEKFIHYLEKHSNEQLPPYTHSLLSGTKIGVFLKYSNIPFFNTISLDVYPLTLSPNVINDLEVKDQDFLKNIEVFLQKKGFLYHIDYELISNEFSGYIKDVDENYILKNNAQVIMKLEGTTFNGNGDLIAPSSLQFLSKNIDMRVLNVDEQMSFSIENFSAASNFENQTTYLSSYKLDNLMVVLQQENAQKEQMDISKMYLNLSSNTQNELAEINTKLSFEEMYIQRKDLDINASNFNYDIAVSKMDKRVFKELTYLISQAKSSHTNNDKNIEKTVIDLLAKGLQLNVIDLSSKKIIFNNDDLKGFTISSELELEEDPYLASKIMISPLLVVGNIDFDFQSKISKKLLDTFVASIPVPLAVDKYIQSINDEVDLNVSYRQGSLKINGQTLLGR